MTAANTPSASGRAGARRATSADVAIAAGVSRATVSYVLNDTPGQSIPDATRERVLDAADQLNYQPSAAARTLRSGTSDIVLFLMPDWPTSEVSTRLIEAVARGLAAHGMTFLSHPLGGSTDFGALWRTVTPAVVVTDARLAAPEMAALAAAGVAHVSIAIDNADQPAAGEVPQERIGQLQVEHLVALGHRQLGYAAPDDPRLDVFLHPRLRGARLAAAQLGLNDLDVRTVGAAVGSGAEAVRAWHGNVTGVCAYNDDLALAVMAGARDVGVEVPGELSIVGADDTSAGRMARPTLTTVAMGEEEFAGAMVEAILHEVGRRPEPPSPVSSSAMQIIGRASPASRRGSAA